jgi:hypothetical protein
MRYVAVSFILSPATDDLKTIASETPCSLRSWTQHIKGATSILRLRGEAQLHEEVGRRLFVQLRSPSRKSHNLLTLHVGFLISKKITTCLQRRLAVPEEIQEWSRVSKQYESIEELSTSNLSEIVMQLCALRSTIDDLCDHRNSFSVVSLALEIDDSFSEWLSGLPPRYFYNTVAILQAREDVFSDRYHVYSGVCIATTWNNYRCLRIILNEILIEQMIHLCQTQLYSSEPNDELINFYRSRTRACQTS